MAELSYQDLESCEGWPLRTLFERFVLQHPDVIEIWTEAATAFERVPFDLTFDEINTLLPIVQWTFRLDAKKLIHQLELFANPPIQEKSELALWTLFTKYNAMIDLLRSGFFQANAVSASNEKTCPIEPRFWWSKLYVLDLEKSSILIPETDGLFERYSELEIKRTSINPELFDGLSLSDAFHQMVLRDSGVRCVADFVEKESLLDVGHAVMGEFWSGQNHHPFWWPAAIADRSGPLPYGSQSNEGLFLSAVADRMRQFLAPLRAGDVVAKGLNLSDQPLSIPRNVWNEEGICIHAFEHSVGRLGEGRIMSRSGVDIRFQNVELEVKEKTVHVPRSPRLDAKVTSGSVADKATGSSTDIVELSSDATSLDSSNTVPAHQGVSVGTVIKWFEDFAQDQLASGIRPKKADVQSLAISKFPGLSPNFFSEEIWKKQAPDEWKKRGRRKMTAIKPKEKR